MNVEQIIVTIVVAIIGTMSGVAVERQKQKREKQKETDQSSLELERARLLDDGSRRKEIDDGSREIRDFLKRQVHDLTESLETIERLRAEERERWNVMIGTLSVKNLEFELTHKRDAARIAEMEEEAQALDARIQTQRIKINTMEVEASVMIAKLEVCKGECLRLRSRKGKRQIDGQQDLR